MYVLFGSGTIGRVVARKLNGKSLCFADNDQKKWGEEIEGLLVLSPEDAKKEYPDAKWVAAVHRFPARPEILKQLKEMEVEQTSLYEFLPAKLDVPPLGARASIESLLADGESIKEWLDQVAFRKHPGWQQRYPRDIANVYFEDFFARLEDEVFYDCGAADGDTVQDFLGKWQNFKEIVSFEPDPKNHAAFLDRGFDERVNLFQGAVSDFNGYAHFDALGDQTSHLAEEGIEVRVFKIDGFGTPPTLIKMDIEGAELEGLWGARETIRKHQPVLAICAYHTGNHLWQIPLLIHAINPEYRLYFRRYLEATWELIWYAVPPDRVK